MTLTLHTAAKSAAKLRIGLAGPSGSGKTYSALRLAHGICDDWSKIAVIDTENGSADLYSTLGGYQVLTLTAPYSPECYMEAIDTCVAAGMEVIIIDSITHEWTGEGGCLDLHEKETAKMRLPNSFTAWAKITPLHNAFIQKILQCPCHVITTVRSKTEYILTDKNGKQVPTKAGMGQVTRDGFEYELTLSFDLDQGHKAFASKDRTSLFTDVEPTIISEKTGEKLSLWSQSESTATNEQIGEISKLLKELGSDGAKLPEYYGVKKLTDLSYSNATRCIASLNVQTIKLSSKKTEAKPPVAAPVDDSDGVLTDEEIARFEAEDAAKEKGQNNDK